MPPPRSDGGGSGGGGGVSVPYTISGTYWKTNPTRLPGVPGAAGRFAGCGRDPQGQSAVGVTWSYRVRDFYSTAGEAGIVTRAVPASLKTRCLFPPRYRRETWVCPVSLSATITRQDSPIWDLNGRVKMASQTTTFGKSRALNACGGTYSLSINTPLLTWARYSAAASTQVVSGLVRIYTTVDPRTGRVPAPALDGRWSAPYTVSPATARAQTSCRGTITGWDYTLPGGGSYTFTSRDCPSTGPSMVTCAVKGAPTMAWTDPATRKTVTRKGGTGAAGHLIDDGRTWKVTWPKPRLTGAAKVHSSTTTLRRTGSPWRDGKPLNVQPFVADVGQTRAGLVNTPWAHAWQAASNPAGGPTKTWLDYKVDADWRTTVPVITSINTKTGAITLGSRPGTVRAIGYCESDPLVITATRARLTN